MSELLVTTHQYKRPMAAGRQCAHCVHAHKAILKATAYDSNSLTSHLQTFKLREPPQLVH